GWGRRAGRGTGWANGGPPGADRQFSGDEVGAPRRAASLGVVVGEQHAFVGKLIQVWCAACHHAAMVGAQIEPADVVTHNEEDIRSLARALCRLLLCLS